MADTGSADRIDQLELIVAGLVTDIVALRAAFPALDGFKTGKQVGQMHLQPFEPMKLALRPDMKVGTVISVIKTGNNEWVRIET